MPIDHEVYFDTLQWKKMILFEYKNGLYAHVCFILLECQKILTIFFIGDKKIYQLK